MKTTLDRRHLTLALAFQAALLVLTHIPQERVSVNLNWLGVDKAFHALAYGSLTFLLLRAFGLPRRPLLLMMVAAYLLVVAALDEWTQGFVGRSASHADFVADGVGMLAVGVWASAFGRGYATDRTLPREADPPEAR